jgi:hypothetical protein
MLKFSAEKSVDASKVALASPQLAVVYRHAVRSIHTNDDALARVEEVSRPGLDT